MLLLTAACSDRVDLGHDGRDSSVAPSGEAGLDAGRDGSKPPADVSGSDVSGSDVSGPLDGTATGVCTPGKDQTCNDDPAAAAFWGTCNADGSCTCAAGAALIAATGRCRFTPCTPGQDQTCNADPAVSALWGYCSPQGTCSCKQGFVLDPATARCAPDTACAAEIAAIAAECYAQPGSCTAVVRLDHDSLKVLGYQLFWGKYAATTEAQARAAAQQDTGQGASGVLLGSPGASGTYVFYQAAGDFGGVAAVSSHTALSVFGGSIVWDGTGDISYPTTWRPAATAGSSCPSSGGIPAPVEGYDLVDGTSLGQAEVDAAVKVVLQTAIPAAIWQGGYVFDAVVLRYPRTVGAFDPTTAEWIVIVNGGWLE